MRVLAPRCLTRAFAIGALAVPTGPSIADELFALVDTGELFASNDQGISWDVRAALPVSDAVGLVAGASSAELYLATASGAIYRSMDAGVIWIATGAVSAPDVVALHIRPDGGLLVLTRSGLIFASDDASTFVSLSALTASNLVGMTRHPGPIYALTETGEVTRSEDDGATWTTVGVLAVSNAVGIASSSLNAYVITSTGDVWASSDGGATWGAIATLSQVHTSGFVRSFDGAFYAGVREGEIARSSDGIGWSWVGTTNQLNVVALATDEPIVSVPTGQSPTPALAVRRPWPNPLVGTPLGITFDVRTAVGGRMDLEIFDVGGRRVGFLSRVIESGNSRVVHDLSRMLPGVYVVRIAVGGERVSHRVVLAR